MSINMKEKQQQGQSAKPKEQASLSDIIASIRTMIDDKEPLSERGAKIPSKVPAAVASAYSSEESEEEDILELCEEYETESFKGKDLGLDSGHSNISDSARLQAKKQIDRFAKIANQSEAIPAKENSATSRLDLDQFAEDIMRPMLKSWLDSNMPQLVEKVVREEIRQLMPKK